MGKIAKSGEGIADGKVKSKKAKVKGKPSSSASGETTPRHCVKVKMWRPYGQDFVRIGR
jgi:hypothetical protein